MNTPERMVPTTRPRSLGCASSEASGIACCERPLQKPIAKLAAVAMPRVGAKAIASNETKSAVIWLKISVRLSTRSPSGTRSSVPAKKPPNVHVGIHPIALGVAAALVAIVGIAASFTIPSLPSKTRLPYLELLKSVGELYVRHRRIRHPSAVQFFTGLCYGGFWATVAGMLLSVHGYGPAVAGLIGIPGAAGIFIARPAGRWMDRHGIAPVVAAGVTTIIVAEVVFGFALSSIVFVVAGVALLDCGLRATLVANQTAATHAAPEARSRATTIFTAHMWGGNSVGAAIGSYAYAHWGWLSVCAIGVTASLVALVIATITNRSARAV